MSTNKNENVIVAFFPDEGAAKQAVDTLQTWDKASKDIQLGAIGTITKQGDKVKTHVGRKTGKGAKTGAILGIIAAVLSGGLTLVGGVVAGAVGGGALGTFFKNSLHLTKEEIQSIGTELDAGKVAVVVTCDKAEIAPTSEQLKNAGGTLRTYAVPEAALTETAQAVEQEATQETSGGGEAKTV